MDENEDAEPGLAMILWPAQEMRRFLWGVCSQSERGNKLPDFERTVSSEVLWQVESEAERAEGGFLTAAACAGLIGRFVCEWSEERRRMFFRTQEYVYFTFFAAAGVEAVQSCEEFAGLRRAIGLLRYDNGYGLGLLRPLRKVNGKE